MSYQVDEVLLQDFVARGLAEDIGSGDVTSLACIDPDSVSTAKLLIKDDGVLAGLEVAKHVFTYLDPNAELIMHKHDGEWAHFGDIGFEVRCKTQALLQGERLALNTMQRMSGIATLSNAFKFEVEDLPVKILDTRKTTPLIRFLEKWAVQLGGCHNYRFGLYDWFMIKDNHVEACGSIQKAIERVHAYQQKNNLNLGITVEVRNLVELHDTLAVGGITRIMLDNFELPLMKEAVEIINKRFEVEASGGVDLHTVRPIALTGVDYISSGALTHHATSLDISLKIVNSSGK